MSRFTNKGQASNITSILVRSRGASMARVRLTLRCSFDSEGPKGGGDPGGGEYLTMIDLDCRSTLANRG